MKNTVPSKYHDILTPDYSVGCKRRVVDGGWFSALYDDKIELTTLPLTSIQSHSITLGPASSEPMTKCESKEARQVPADVIILANGFDVGEWLHPLKVRGRKGRFLHDVWHERGGAQAYLGLAMDGFPNFFMIFGPNTVTGHSSVILASENMVNYTLKFIKPILEGSVSQVEVKHEAEVGWTQKLQEKLKKTVFTNGGCRSWYRTDNGWNSVAYPYAFCDLSSWSDADLFPSSPSYSQVHFALKCMFPRYSDWNIRYTTRGIWRRRLKEMLRVVAFALLVLGISQARQKGYALRDGPTLIRAAIRQGIQSGIKGMEALRGRL